MRASPACGDLLPQHARLLTESAIAGEVAIARGYRSITERRELEALDFARTQRHVPTLLVPIHDVHGKVALYQHRPDEPRTIRGKTLRYETPKGARLVLDVPPPIREQLDDPAITLVVTEGARKADAAVSAGLCTIALLGVWGWRGRNKKGGRTALACWEAIALTGRLVHLVFDSDVTVKAEVQLALKRLSAFLRSRGARVEVIYLPAGEGGSKVGLDDYLAAGHSVDELLSLATSELREPDHGGLRRITVSNRPLRHKTTDAIAALQDMNEPPKVFVRGGHLVRVRTDENDRPIIELLGEDELRGHLARAADFFETDPPQGERHVSPPRDVVRDVLTLGTWPFPPLQMIVEVPVLRADGSVLDLAGYDAASRIVYAPAPGLVIPKISLAPMQTDVATARAVLLDELLGDFPFVDAASRANAIALMITPVVRPMIRGPIPLALLDKPGAGTGASLLAEVLSWIATGREGAMMSAPRDDEEWRKQITSVLLDGPAFVLIDNVVGRLHSPALARVLTCSTWKDRLLGRNVTVELPQRAIWVATGNNIRIGGDLARRSYWIRMDSKMARPYLRDESEFRHPLPAWAIEHRGELLAAVLTMVRGWVVAARPQAKTPSVGGFAEWARTVGSILAFSDIDGFLGNAAMLYDQIDEEAAAWEAFLGTWFEVFGDTAVEVANIETEVRGEGSALRAALPPELATALDKKKFATSLGYALRSRREQVIGHFRLEQAAPEKHKKVARWRVIIRTVEEKSRAKSTEAFGLAGDAGDSPSPRVPGARTRATNGAGAEESPASPACPAASGNQAPAGSETPNDRVALLSAAREAGFRRLQLRPAVAIVGGEEGWRKFVSRACADDLAAAMAALTREPAETSPDVGRLGTDVKLS